MVASNTNPFQEIVMLKTRITGVLLSLLATAAHAESIQAESIIVQSTTSTANSGLYDAILPVFEAESGIKVNVVAVGTGQAIRNARNCDGDVLLVHAKPAEERFVQDGFGTSRTDLMYNDFVILGPKQDPAQVSKAEDVTQAMAQIAQAQALFASRGDDSGTHKKERALWNRAQIDPSLASGTWYREPGSGRGATLNAAIGMGAYVMSDRATWISFGNKQDYDILLQGDAVRCNQYGIIPCNPEACPNVKQDEAQKFTDWMLSDAGQAEISAYSVANQQLFYPNAPQSQ
jgi:tungstate transport system substrate-binding protein